MRLKNTWPTSSAKLKELQRLASSDPLLTATLADADKYVLGAFCQQCRKPTREIDLRALRDDPRYGPALPLHQIRERLRCGCGARGPVVTILHADTSIAKARKWVRS